jgi:cyclic 2,3-diphosphoglycerate synthetase
MVPSRTPPETLSSREESSIRYVAVVDGEHYPAVIGAAFRELEGRGDEVLAAVLAGGREKLPDDELDEIGGVTVLAGGDPRELLGRAIKQYEPEAVADLSDEPVLDYRRRHQMAAVAMSLGVAYHGADFRFMPPPRPHLCTKPSVAIIGTGKRTGKTAVAGFVARTLAAAGTNPVIVAMGRGGPEEPEVLRGDELELQAKDLIELADSGRHAASDYIEDAALSRVPTIGCRRCGGGLAGGVEISNVAAGIEKANELPGDMILLEGSGSSIPPAHADATVLIVPATIPAEYLVGYMGPFRLLLADVAVITMCDDPHGSPSEVSSLIRDAFRSRDGAGGLPQEEIQVIHTVFRPHPTRSVDGADVFVATTAPAHAGDSMRAHLEDRYGCTVKGITHSLSDRKRLREEIEHMADRTDLLLCEIKAAAIDVAARQALDAGLDVVFMDNVPEGIDGDDPTPAVLEVAGIAKERSGL